MDSLIIHKSNAPKEAKKTADWSFDRIYKYYFNKKTNVELTEKENHIRERWDFAWKMLHNMYTPRQVAEAITQRFPEIKKATAFNDVRYAMALFGNPQQSNKEAKRMIAEEWIVKGIKQAWDDKDLDAYERLIARYAKINKLEQEDGEDVGDVLKKLKPTTIILNFRKEEVEKEAERLHRELTLDVEHEEASE